MASLSTHCLVDSSNLGYLSASKLLILYHHLSLHLFLLPFKGSNPISTFTASLHVLEEQPSTFLAAPSGIDSKEAVRCPALHLFPEYFENNRHHNFVENNVRIMGIAFKF